MRVAFCRAFLVLSSVLLSTSAVAEGPSFNLSRKELSNLSVEAGASLHEGLAAVHGMVQYLERSKPEDAERSRTAALKSLDAAIGLYKKIAEGAPRQPLVIKPRTEQQTRALDLLRRAIESRPAGSKPNMVFPETERELADIAVQVVSDFRNALSASDTFNAKSARAFAYFERLFREESFLLNVGLFCSVIWELHELSQK